MTEIPKFTELMNPLIKALIELGGSGSIDEIYEKVLDILDLPEDLVNTLHDPETGNRTEIEYRLAWARTYLKKYGLLENSSRGVWSILGPIYDIDEVDPRRVSRIVKEQDQKQKVKIKKKVDEIEDIAEDDIPDEVQSWREKLHHILTNDLDPAAFERLIKRVLRESGFIQVEVTGRAGDGGIDGKGIIRVNGVLSFHVVFQCKRYKGSVSSNYIRDFRGAMIGRADKGLLITTGTFTRDANKEATRDGAPAIDLIDGDQLADKLKELSLGIKTEVIEKITVNDGWFKNI